MHAISNQFPYISMHIGIYISQMFFHACLKDIWQYVKQGSPPPVVLFNSSPNTFKDVEGAAAVVVSAS